MVGSVGFRLNRSLKTGDIKYNRIKCGIVYFRCCWCTGCCLVQIIIGIIRHERRCDSYIMIIGKCCLLLQVVSSSLSAEPANIFSIRSWNGTVQQDLHNQELYYNWDGLLRHPDYLHWKQQWLKFQSQGRLPKIPHLL